MDISFNVASACCSLLSQKSQQQQQQQQHITGIKKNPSQITKSEIHSGASMNERIEKELKQCSCNNISLSLSLNSHFLQLKINEWTKIILARAYIICAKSNTGAHILFHTAHFAQRKRLVSDELPTKWNDSHTNKHILYLIDLVVYYLCLVRLHNSPGGKKKDRRWAKKTLEEQEKAKEHKQRTKCKCKTTRRKRNEAEMKK